MFGGGGGGGEAPAPEKGEEEGASSEPGKSATLPPKWGFTTSAQVGECPVSERMKHIMGKSVDSSTLKRADATLTAFRRGQDPYVKMLSSQLEPRILADLQTPRGRELVPYIQKEPELK